MDIPYGVIAGIVLAVLIVSMIVILASRFKRCPSDAIMVIYGKVGDNQAARTLHGGGALVIPLFQDYAFLSLTPMTIGIPLQNALSLQNIRINVPSSFTVGISTRPEIMQNASERLLGLKPADIEDMAREIIFGQLRLTVASLTIEQINQDRESFLTSIRNNVEPELNKIGLYLINVNITDITDESDYINSIGKKAAAEAINRAYVDVAEEEKLGAIGQAVATREREIKVAENLAGAEKGKKQAEADQRVFVQQQETMAMVGESVALRDKEIRIAENQADAAKGVKKADAERRIFVQEQEADAVKGENISKARIADAEAELAVKEAEAYQVGEVAKLRAIAEIQKAKSLSEEERLVAEQVVPRSIERRKVEIDAAAEGEKLRLIAKGDADAILAKYRADAEGIQNVLESKAMGYAKLVESCAGDTRAASTLLMIEKLESLVATQVEAVKNLKIDKITVWDSAGGHGDGSSTANFLSGLVRSLPPLQDLAGMAGVELPEYLGKVKADSDKNAPSPTAKAGSER